MDVLKINGVEKEFADGQLPATLAQILEQLGVEAATVVAEIEGQIIEREKFAQTQVQKGQSIELVRFVPGREKFAQTQVQKGQSIELVRFVPGG
jgi:sulfur carrier protein